MIVLFVPEWMLPLMQSHDMLKVTICSLVHFSAAVSTCACSDVYGKPLQEATL